MDKHNIVGNRILFAFAGTEPMLSSGELAELELIPVATSSENNESAFDAIGIEYIRLNEFRESSVSINRQTVPKTLTLQPSVNRLGSVYPNPFGGRLNVRYSVREKQHVKLFVCDLRGRKPATLVDGMVDAGNHSIVWQNSSVTSQLSAQVYLLRLTGRDFVQTARLFKVR